MKEIIAIYKREQELLARYRKAKEAGDEAGMQDAREKHQAVEAHLEAQGREFCWAYRLFEEQQERGNAYIDLHDTMQDAKISVYIETLKKLGFKNFTFSSTWSSAVETAWIFTQNGCSLKGLIEINSPYKDFMGEGYEKAHGYLFSID